MLDVRRLRLLCDLSRLGTIAAVAQACNYTASAVSQQLTALEKEAGVPLLERTGRSVRLTAAGHTLAAHGDVVLAALERADASLATLRRGLTGPLRIGAFPTAVRSFLPSALVELGARHPGLELMVTEIDPAEVPAALRESRLDVGLISDYDLAPALPDPQLHSTALLTEQMYVAVPDGVRARTVGELHAEPWILAGEGTQCHAVTVQVCRDAGFTPRARHHADDFATVLALVAAGQGVSLVPWTALTDGVPPGTRLIEAPTRRRSRIAYRRSMAAHPAVRAFAEAARAAARNPASVPAAVPAF